MDELIIALLDWMNSIYFLFSVQFSILTDKCLSGSYRSFCIAVDIGLTVGLTDLFLSQIIISSAILSSAHCAVSRASASWSQQSSIVSLSDLTACNKKTHQIGISKKEKQHRFLVIGGKRKLDFL